MNYIRHNVSIETRSITALVSVHTWNILASRVGFGLLDVGLLGALLETGLPLAAGLKTPSITELGSFVSFEVAAEAIKAARVFGPLELYNEISC